MTDTDGVLCVCADVGPCPLVGYELLLAGIFHLLWIARCSTGLNGLDPEQIEDRGWRLSLDAIDSWNVMLRSLPCVPAIKLQHTNISKLPKYNLLIYVRD